MVKSTSLSQTNSSVAASASAAKTPGHILEKTLIDPTYDLLHTPLIMKRPALLVALLTLLGFIAIPLLAQNQKGSSPRGKAPKGWMKFDWPEKNEVLLTHFAPTAAELDLIKKATPKKPTAAPSKKRRILAFYKCNWAHSSIATGLEAFRIIGQQTKAYEFTATDDPAHFTYENLAQYDAILLNNSTDFETFLTKEQREAFLDFVKSGKGLIGIHGGSDACKKWKEGAQAIGGVFGSHPWSASGEWAIKVESTLHPLNGAWGGKGDLIRDEIYQYHPGTFSRERSRVLLSLDMSKQRNFQGSGISKKQAKDLKADGDHPIAWIHELGQGRVFYSNFGHNHFTYWNPKILQHFLDGIQYALGDLPADATPSAKLKTTLIKEAPMKKVIFLAGKPSHASGQHEFRAGSMLLAQQLNSQTDLPVQAEVISGWPKDDTVLDDAASIIIYCDSDSVMRSHYPRLMELSKNGTGLLLMHYGVHPKKPQDGKDYYLPTIGGFMETGFSVNPHWVADLKVASGHPIRRGCEKPITILDEFYYNMRFADKAIPLATAVPDKDKMKTINLWNDHGTAGLGKPQTLLWGFETPSGTRGAGYTGGHYHRNWANDGVRTMILNTIVWTAGLEVPEGGVKSQTPSEDEINANLDKKKDIARIGLPLKKADLYLQEMIKARAARDAKTAKKKKTKKPTAKPAARKNTEEQTKEKKKPEVKSQPKTMKEAKPTSKTKSKAAPKTTSTPALKWRNLLDSRLSDWDIWMGVPHKTVTIPNHPAPTSPDGMKGTPLGLDIDPLNIFSAIEEDGHPVLKITGEIYAGLTTKEEYQNYHLTLQTKWGEKKWEPRLEDKRDSGILLHCVGPHGAFWNVWKRSLECQVQEGDIGDFIALAGTTADLKLAPGKSKKWEPKGTLSPYPGYTQHGPSEERPNGEWNTIDIYTVGDQMIFAVNGKVNMALQNTRQKTAHGPAPLTKGQIQIQSEAAEVYYREIKIRPITEFPTAFQQFLK